MLSPEDAIFSLRPDRNYLVRLLRRVLQVSGDAVSAHPERPDLRLLERAVRSALVQENRAEVGAIKAALADFRQGRRVDMVLPQRPDRVYIVRLLRRAVDQLPAEILSQLRLSEDLPLALAQEDRANAIRPPRSRAKAKP